jgi:hypothetical protein
MDESFLHFVWKFHKFNTIDLQTNEGETISIFDSGQHNHDAGPDFQNARLKLSDLQWNGHVEIHIKSSDWRHHNHGKDPNYDNVILHVVWENDEPTLRNDQTHIPTLELKHRVNPNLVTNYKTFLAGQHDILCKHHLPTIPRLVWIGQLDRMLAKRLEQKAERIIKIAEATNNDWEETAYRVLARTFGFSLNSEVFERLSETLPQRILSKHAGQPKQVEALLFGQAGFLDEVKGEYGLELQQEYHFLQAKYELTGHLHRTHWTFGKMRPSNFPTVRLAQFAAILNSNTALFSFLKDEASTEKIKKHLSGPVSDYWQTHYDFDKELKKGNNQTGAASMDIIMINAVSPLIAAYALHTDQLELMDNATSILEQIRPERNRYTLKWNEAGKVAKSAFDSQAMITLFKDYCSRKKCLNCTIGTSLFSK